jgi:hypothetical protein
MTRVAVSVVAFALAAATARAHFVWLIPAESGDSAAAVYSDSPKTDGAEPLTLGPAVTLILRHPDGQTELVKGMAGKHVCRITCPGTGARVVAAARNSFSSGDRDLLRTAIGVAYLVDPAAKSREPNRLPEWEELGVTIVPKPDKGADVFRVAHRGKAIAGAVVQVYRPGDADTDAVPTFTTDAGGYFTVKSPPAGRYGLLVEQQVEEKGTHAGRPYKRRFYWSTLVVGPLGPDLKNP